MSTIERAELFLVNLQPKVTRTDSIQSFISQETPIVRLTCSDGCTGVGYSYTIGTGGSSVCALLADHLLPLLIGENGDQIETIWSKLKASTNATMPGAISALALAAIDTALWDLRCRRTQLPLHVLAGGAKQDTSLYSTECGWLHLSREELCEGVSQAQAEGFCGAKIKVGKPDLKDDLDRLTAVRASVDDDFQIMVDCNQAFTLDEALRRARAFDGFNLSWIEEPLAADDINGHRVLSQHTSIPIAVGESIYSLHHFKEFMRGNCCSVVQVDAARIGGITPWLKVAHCAEAFNLAVAPHFLMELHVSLVCASPAAKWVEYIPQLDDICLSAPSQVDGKMSAPNSNDIGIEWDWDRIVSSNTLPSKSEICQH